MSRRIRLTVVMTHPVQYYSPWFRYLSRELDELRLTVLYASEPTPVQQGVGFAESFAWDVPLRDGYDNTVVRPARLSDRFDAGSFWGLDVPEIGDAIEATSPDVVLLTGWHSVTLVRAMRACRRRRVPLVYRGDTHLQGRSPGLGHALWTLRTRWLLRRFDRYLSVGVRAREYFESFRVPETLVFHSPHAVDNDFFARGAAPFQTEEARRKSREELGIPTDGFVVLFVGKLEPKKRPQDLLLSLPRMGRGVFLLVAGSGPLRDELERLASSLDVAVRWHGFVNQSRLGRVYAVSDCLALPSDWGETWGLVVNEAMATGLPCVVSERVGCARDLVEPGRTGEVHPLADPSAIASAIDRIRVDDSRRNGRAQACREKIQEYTFEAASAGLVSACRSVMR